MGDPYRTSAGEAPPDTRARRVFEARVLANGVKSPSGLLYLRFPPDGPDSKASITAWDLDKMGAFEDLGNIQEGALVRVVIEEIEE